MLTRISDAVNRGVEGLLFALGLSMSLVVAAQVFSRYVLNHSLFWSEELARYFLVWLTFLGATVAYRRGVHPGVDVLYRRLPAGLQHGCRIAVHLTSIGLFGVMTYFGVAFAWFVRLQITPALGLPKWTVLGIIPLSGLIFLLHALAFFIADLRRSSP
ncbi:MAG: TRAP transporter small permease [Desulfococcaceae bacterium]